jgi:hypothetical protein
MTITSTAVTGRKRLVEGAIMPLAQPTTRLAAHCGGSTLAVRHPDGYLGGSRSICRHVSP